MKAFFYRLLFFITFSIYLFVYWIISTVEIFVFVFVGKENPVVSTKYKQFLMSNFFIKILEKCTPQTMFDNPLVGGKFRNATCVCGSGEKVKKCHGKKSSLTKEEAREIARLISEVKRAL